jgi:membrane protein DedA with SNARE-associated domain
MELFTAFAETHPFLIYALAFVMMFIEGDISLLLFGALGKEKVIGFSQVFMVAFVATIIHDLLFWKLGGWLARREKKKYLRFDLDKFVGFMDRYKQFTGMFIILSKFAWNFNRIILVSVGYIKIPFRKVLKFSAITALLWPSLYMTVGYIFADQTDLFKQRLEVIALIVVGIIILLMVFERYIRRFVDHILTSKMTAENDCSEKTEQE